MFKPKDIVSGDFYWATAVGNKDRERFYLAVCDITGHGVPGAFMSLLNITFLNEAISEKGITEPGKILDHVRSRLIDNISKEGQKDGFDGILLCINCEHGKITSVSYAAANNTPLLIVEGEDGDAYAYVEGNYDPMPVGLGERDKPFSTFTIDSSGLKMLYLYTDGYADQFGGPKGKKFKYKPLHELLTQVPSATMQEQYDVLNDRFEQWKGSLEQVDDVCLIGIKLG